MIKNIHTAQITIGSHDQIMIGDYDRLPEATGPHHLSDEERRQNQERVRALIQKIDAGNEAGR